MTQPQLLEKVHAMLQSDIAAGRDSEISWLVQSFLSRHKKVYGKDKSIALLCMAEHVRDTVRSAARLYRPHPDEPENRDLLLPGFKHVQKAYDIKREGRERLIRTDRMTPAELRLKALEIRRMGAGCYEHADEFDRLADEREANGA